jgi:hypothetical protein
MCTISRVQDGTLKLQLGMYRFRDEGFALELHGHRITHPITSINMAGLDLAQIQVALMMFIFSAFRPSRGLSTGKVTLRILTLTTLLPAML